LTPNLGGFPSSIFGTSWRPKLDQAGMARRNHTACNQHHATAVPDLLGRLPISVGDSQGFPQWLAGSENGENLRPLKGQKWRKLR